MPSANLVPKVAFCLTVGITGHRALGGDTGPLRAAVVTILTDLRDAAARLHASEREMFAATALPPRLLGALAEGADQIAAEVALDLGFELHAVLPFERREYAVDFTDPAAGAGFDALLARAARVCELPCRRDEEIAAYGLAGRATVAHCDVLIAVWDGLPARGPGGTAEVVEFAARRGVPVVHISPDAAVAPRLIRSAHHPHLSTSRLEDFASTFADAEALDAVIRQRLGPPGDAGERAHLAAFHAEHEHRFRLRLEYPLLLALTGAARLRLGTVWAARYLPGAAAEWLPFRAAAKPLIVGLPLDPIEHSYAWSDRLAAYYAQNYRSGHVFNFAIAAIAVLLALSGLLMPTVKLWLAVTELAAIGALVLNTRIGTTRNWHRRWLDYRQLAERLRPMRSLCLMALAQPGLDGASRGSRSWVDWYAAGVWRSVGIPSGRFTGSTRELAAVVAAEDVEPQIAYHRASAATISHLDHRLHTAGTVVFALSCISSAAFIVAYFVAHEWVVHHAAAFVAISAGLPAVGTALFGIRVQGDFAGTAARSLVTVDHLTIIAATLRDPECGLSRAADATEAAARAMLADLGEWRLSHQQRQLEIG